MRSIFFAPHSDDECLFGAFTLLKYQPTVVICFPSSGDYGSTEERFNESVAAGLNLGVSDVRQWDGTDLSRKMIQIKQELRPDVVWVPSLIASHKDHVAVCQAGELIFPGRVRHYETYSGGSKDRYLPPAPIDDPWWPAVKHFALTKYESQIRHPRAGQFFMWDLAEYVEQP